MLQLLDLKGLWLIRVMLNFDFLDPGQKPTLKSTYARFTDTKIGYGALKKPLPLVYRKVREMRLYSSIGVEDIWTSAGTRAKYPYRQSPCLSFFIKGN